MITRNNYEEFFLLYVDNELSAADRLIVEKWVAENPDLKEEWHLLLQCRIKPDDHLAFADPQSLFKKEGALAEDNYLEYFLSYVDGELDHATRMSVEDFVRRHPSLRPEFEKLQQTVSVPDPAIVFENKEILYRKEGDRKVVVFPWRIAAAAVIAGAIALAIFNLLQRGPHDGTSGAIAGDKGNKTEQPAPGNVNKTVQQESGSGDKSVRQAAPGSTAESTAPERPQKTPGSAGKERSVNNESTAANNQLADNNNSAGKNKSNVNGRPVIKKIAPAVTPGPATALNLSGTGQPDRTAEERNRTAGVSKNRIEHDPHTYGKEKERGEDPDNNALVQTDPLINKRVIDQAPVRVITTGIKGPGNKTIVLTGLAEDNNSFATRTSLNSSADDPEDGDGMLSSSPGKNRLRGLFRKVSRVLEKSSSRDEDDKRHVLIGGFQFALK